MLRRMLIGGTGHRVVCSGLEGCAALGRVLGQGLDSLSLAKEGKGRPFHHWAWTRLILGTGPVQLEGTAAPWPWLPVWSRQCGVVCRGKDEVDAPTGEHGQVWPLLTSETALK